jgi:hypothetical protein
MDSWLLVLFYFLILTFDLTPNQKSMKAVLLIVPMFVLLSISSCSKTCYCTDAMLSLGYVAFDNAETDTIILRRYDRNSNFSRLLDTAILTNQNTVFSSNGDTVFIRSNIEATTLRSFYNYVFYLPALNRSDSVNGIFEARDKEEGSHDMQCNCINKVLSYQLNGDTLQIVDPASPFIYITK